MRVTTDHDGLRVHAVAGTHTVLLGFDLDDPTGCLGFGVHRTDHTEDEAYWLRGLKTFASVVPNPAAGMDFSLRTHPVQGFQWGDYTAKPQHDYSYRVVAWGGRPGRLKQLAAATVRVTTEAEDDGRHGVWFNRGVAGSQAYVKRFGADTPPAGVDESHPAFAWLSRGLGEAFVGAVAGAADSRWGLRGAFYEFTWATGLRALADAAARGVDVRLVVHGRDGDSPGGDDLDHTAADNRAAVAAAGLDPVVTWRTAPNKGALQHNKFLALTHDGAPVAVWTGSTNLTQGAVFGHLNVGHLVHDPVVAAQFVAYWAVLADQQNTTAAVRAWTQAHNPVDLTVPPPEGATTVLSPRERTSTLLDWYADAFAAATSSAHVTGAFGLNQVFRDRLAVPGDVVRTVLLDKRPPADAPIPQTDPDVRVSWGSYLLHPVFEQWAAEHLTGFNAWVKFIHTKIILVDPLTDDPTVITGSANYSVSSTVDNEENSVVIRGPGDPAVQRVADIYLTEYQRLFIHFVFRSWANTAGSNQPGSNQPGGAVGVSGARHLSENDSWSHAAYVPGSWQGRQRQTFSAGPS
jgi:phosphatidylserine/phosphatidylglycerophosphate/cardiolipin synthase-like enzyme